MRVGVLAKEEGRGPLVRAVDRVEGWEAIPLSTPEGHPDNDLDALIVDPAQMSTSTLESLRARWPGLPLVVMVAAGADHDLPDGLLRVADGCLVRDDLDPFRITLAMAMAERQRRAERAAANSQAALEDFGRMLSHEIRSPLATMSFSCELLARDSSGEAADRQLGRLRRGVAEISELLDAALEYGGVLDDSAYREADVRELVDRALEQLGEKGLATGTVYVEGSTPVIRCAPAQIVRAVSALVRNALEHGRGTEAPVRIVSERTATDWRISVIDSGSGFPAEPEKLFRVLQTAEGGEHRGLGLAVARRVAEAHGGELLYENAEPGAKLTLVLPVHPVPQALPEG